MKSLIIELNKLKSAEEKEFHWNLDLYNKFIIENEIEEDNNINENNENFVEKDDYELNDYVADKNDELEVNIGDYVVIKSGYINFIN